MTQAIYYNDPLNAKRKFNTLSDEQFESLYKREDCTYEVELIKKAMQLEGLKPDENKGLIKRFLEILYNK